jgi:penicillin amidase
LHIDYALNKMKKLNLIFLLLLIFAPFRCFAQNEDAPRTELKIAGLKSKVTIRRDERGVPHIEAGNEADLYFAQGYVTAQDRLWQMDLLRRVARGELAEIFGRQPYTGGTTVDEDRRWRKLGFARVAEQTLKILPAEPRAALENYARGVNAFIGSLDNKNLPLEFQILQYRPREWQPTDSIVIGKILADALSTTWRFDLIKAALRQDLPTDKQARLFNQQTPDDVLLFADDNTETKTAKSAKQIAKITGVELEAAEAAEAVRRQSLERIGFYAEDLAASNNWVVSGKRTADGKPLLANDPHLPSSLPSIWYLINLNAPEVKIAGVTLPGAPGVILGHNADIAWGATNVGPDVQDLYLETFDSSNPTRYKTPDGWKQAEVRREEIKVRQSPLKTDTTSEFLEVTTTRNGVIYFEESGKRYALRWTAFDPNNNELEAFYYLNHAKNWNDFCAALKTYGGSMQNFIFADIAGNIGWYAAGRVPLRKTGDGSTPYDGATDDGKWVGFVPFEELPHLYNPPRNFIVTANQRIVGKSYKYQEIVRDFAAPFRARRIYDLLAANTKVTIADFNAIQRDVFSIPLSRLAREIVNLKAAAPDTLVLFKAWDGKMNADSKSALLAAEIQNALSKRIFDANLQPAVRKQFRMNATAAFLDRLIQEKPQNWLPKEFSNYTDLLKACEQDARASIAARLGADETKWNWGAVNKINFPHPLANAPLVGGQFRIESLPLNGSSNSPNVGANVSMRFIAVPGNWDWTRHGIALGESGLPTSPHFKDQLDSWYKGETPVLPFTLPAVKRATKEILILTP